MLFIRQWDRFIANFEGHPSFNLDVHSSSSLKCGAIKKLSMFGEVPR